jgi:tetratricopeptide (TPR) repeat protein
MHLGGTTHFSSLQANVAAAYKDAAQHDKAIEAYTRALQLSPHFPEAFANLVHSLQSVCEWRNRDGLFRRLEADVRAALAAGELPAVQPFHAISYPFPPDLVLEARAPAFRLSESLLVCSGFYEPSFLSPLLDSRVLRQAAQLGLRYSLIRARLYRWPSCAACQSQE